MRSWGIPVLLGAAIVLALPTVVAADPGDTFQVADPGYAGQASTDVCDNAGTAVQVVGSEIDPGGNYGISVFTEDPDGSAGPCLVTSLLRYVPSNGEEAVYSRLEDIRDSEEGSEAFGEGRRCWSEHVLSRTDGSGFSARHYNPAGLPSATCNTQRFGGAERIQTSIAISNYLYPSDSPLVADTAFLVRADDFADALSGGPLAVSRSGPILLTESSGLSEATRAELERLLPAGATVNLLGGEAALDFSVFRELAEAGYNVNRFSGDNRYETSAAIADELGDASQEFAFANGNDFRDAVIAGAAMAERDGALLLTNGTRLPRETAGYAARANWAVGNVAAAAVPDAERLAGATSSETSIIVARALFPDMEGVVVATNVNAQFPDALSGGPLAASLNSPMVLTAADELDSAVVSYLQEAKSAVFGTILGGRFALSSTVRQQVSASMDRAGEQ